MAEILSPAGSMDAAIAAIYGGCDAIYLGAKAFSARAGATNFDTEELQQIIDVSHEAGVRVYLAVNTLLKQEELTDAVKCVKSAYEMGIDAVIVQDLGLAARLHLSFPDLPLHASTQMSIHTLQGVVNAAKLGFTRVILSRECSLQEIEYIVKNSPIECEVFVHGALCMSVSGQCLISAFIGGRSGNRGRCAGTCRLPFSCGGADKNRHDLSLKDLCALSYLQTLDKIGVTSFKIEGRLKRPEYVYTVTRECRRALDTGEYDEPLLARLFSRSGFTDGYLTGKRDKDMFGVRTEEDIHTTRKTKMHMERVRRVPVNMDFKMGSQLELTVSDGVFFATATAPNDMLANRAPTTVEKIRPLLQKCGDTPYVLQDLRVQTDQTHFVSAAVGNSLRRQALAKLSQLRIAHWHRTCTKEVEEFYYRRQPAKNYLLAARFESIEQAEGLLDQIDKIYLPIEQVVQKRAVLLPYVRKIVCELPRFCPASQEKKWKDAVLFLKQEGFSHFEANNLAQIEECDHTGAPINVLNASSAQLLARMGVSDLTISVESHYRAMSQFAPGQRLGMIAYGHIPLMIMRSCPLHNKQSCAQCNKKGGIITDRTNRKFVVLCREKQYSLLLNSEPLYLGDKPETLKYADFCILYFTTESNARCKEVLRSFKAGQPLGQKFTRGLYGKGVQ